MMKKYIVMYMEGYAEYPSEIRILLLNRWNTYEEMVRIPSRDAKMVANLILSHPSVRDKAVEVENKPKATKQRNLRANRK